MTSEVDVCNLALSNIRSAGINSLNESSVQAQQCKLKYPAVRDMLLKEVTWKFSHKVAVLALLDTNVFKVFNWVYSYQYPNDCLHINKLILNYETYSPAAYRPDDRLNTGLKPKVPFDVFNINDTLVIAANEPELRIDYRAKVTNPTLFDPIFTQAFAALLASELAIPVVGGELGRAFRKDALSMYSAYIASATASNLNQCHSVPSESEFITVRG